MREAENESRGAKTQQARAAAQQQHGQGDPTPPKAACASGVDGYIQRALAAPQAREQLVELGDQGGLILALPQRQGKLESEQATDHPGSPAARWLQVRSPTYPLHSSASWEAPAVLQPCPLLFEAWDELSIPEERFACNFEVGGDLASWI